MITDMNIESMILSHLVYTEDYSRKVLPYLDREYFTEEPLKVVFDVISDYTLKYNKPPTREAIIIDIKNKPKLSETTFTAAKGIVENLSSENTDLSWLVNSTEKFCKQQAIHNALVEAISVFDPKSAILPDAIPELLSKALAVSFDERIGHDYMADSDQRLEFYQRKDEKIAFNLEYFNKTTRGGIIRKSLTVILAGTGVGKSLSMCHHAAHHLLDGYKVLYITSEMAEEQVTMRIDANLLDVPIEYLEKISKEEYQAKFAALKAKITGELLCREYPTASAHAGHFRSLLKELKQKKNFVPDVIYVDYINIMVSSRVKQTTNVNSYTMIKSIAEELRGLAMEFNCALITATQLTRGGLNSSDPSLTDTSESIGLPFTADLMYALYETEELKKLGQIAVKILKNRYNDLNKYGKFVVGKDASKMRLYNLHESAQQRINQPSTDTKPVFDRTPIGQTLSSKPANDLLAKLRLMT